MADAAIAGAGAVGFDIRKRRTAFARPRHRSIGLPLEWYAAGDPAATAACSIEVDPPQQVSVRGPMARADAVGSEYTDLWQLVTRGYVLNPCEILELRSARFHMPSGIVCAAGRFPSETISLDFFPYRWQYIDCMRALWAPARKLADGYLLTLQQSANYYHWLSEVLPLAYALMTDDGWGELPMYVAADLPSFVFEYLQLLHLGGYCHVLPRGVYHAERLRVPTFPGGSEWPSPDHLLRVREACLRAVGSPVAGRRRLYVSRSDSPDRRVVNEDELLRGIADLGFERVTLSGMDVAQQIQLFQTADIVLAPHGAGNSNILFAPPDCVLVELMGPSLFSACFMVVTSSIGQPYGYVECVAAGQDLIADPKAVRDVLERLLRARETSAREQILAE